MLRVTGKLEQKMAGAKWIHLAILPPRRLASGIAYLRKKSDLLNLIAQHSLART
jgi:hypothetical protein